MKTYEFVTPSDPITFKTDDDKIAFMCGLILGGGKAGVNRQDDDGDEINIPTLLIFHNDPQSVINDYLGMDSKEFVEQNRNKIADCFRSFAYGNFSDRKQFDDAVESITDPVKLQEFKKKHEDRNRSSLSEWVNYAWQLGNEYAGEVNSSKE